MTVPWLDIANVNNNKENGVFTGFRGTEDSNYFNGGQAGRALSSLCQSFDSNHDATSQLGTHISLVVQISFDSSLAHIHTLLENQLDDRYNFVTMLKYAKLGNNWRFFQF